MLTVGYSFRGGNPHQKHDSHGVFYIFGRWDSVNTKRFICHLFKARHGSSKLLEINLVNQQPS